MRNQSVTRKYTAQREPKIPPHISVGVLRKALRLTLEDVADRVEEITNDRPTKGALSAIENGHRGASVQLLSALEQAYDLPAGSITTTYRPRVTTQLAAEPADADSVPA